MTSVFDLSNSDADTCLERQTIGESSR
jgi:hypothetical protein